MFFFGIDANMLWKTYRMNRDAGFTHDQIVQVVESSPAIIMRGGRVIPDAWDKVCRWYEDNEQAQRKAEVHRAYLAMEALAYEGREVRVRSRVGMIRLLEAVFEGYPPIGRTVAQQRRPGVRVKWSWPPEACARAHRARPLIGAV